MNATPESSSSAIDHSVNRAAADRAAVIDTVRVALAAVDHEHVVIEVPGTSYRLRLVCADAQSIRHKIGKRITGRLHGRALRMHTASAGGRFIEPADGMPRIVQGSVQVIEPAAVGNGGRVLVDMVVPVWVSPMPKQCFDNIALGDMVNFYMESGTSFEIVTSATV